ncbi:MAG: class I SAM-dependent methyltransferase [Xanthomonadales bacterium]|nr:class I SAM-dependent methyltransferase [Xanthomonadales bacterium]
MSGPLEFTGERFTPECVREIWYEHYHRYALAARWCDGKRTLDAACGEGYGSAVLAKSGAKVDGVDISERVIAHARQQYGDIEQLDFHVADCTDLPFADSEFDRVVSFETLEHLATHDELLTEFKRVLKPDGFLVLSSPDKAVYSEGEGTVNEFHVRELYREELEALIARHFPASRLLGQKLMFHSAIWSMEAIDQVALDQVADGESGSVRVIKQPAMYFIALCAAAEKYLPDLDGRLWLFDDLEESVYQHYHGEVRRNMAAGGIIAGLEKKIAELSTGSEQAGVAKRSWWRRLLHKS